MTSFSSEKFDLVVLGGGPAGVSGAAAAGLIGKQVALVEKSALSDLCKYAAYNAILQKRKIGHP